MMSEADSDGDGRISYGEFAHMMLARKEREEEEQEQVRNDQGWGMTRGS